LENRERKTQVAGSVVLLINRLSMKNFLLKKIVISTVILLAALNVFAYEINIHADNLAYDERKNQLLAKGNVIFEWEGKKVFADYAEFYKKTVKAHSNVKIEESGNEIYADNVVYSYDEKNGCIEETFGYQHSSNVFIHAKSMEIQNKDGIYAINGIKLSKCDLDNPHVHIRANHGKLVLNKKLTIYNAVFYIGKIPVFYFPIFTKSLKSKKSFGSDLNFEIKPQFPDSKTMYLNMVVSSALSESLKGKISTDFFRKSGNSNGIRIDYAAQSAVGSISANETKKLEKWVLMANYSNMISSIWGVRSKAWVASKDINNYSYEENKWDIWDLFFTDLYPYSHSYVTVTRYGCDTNLNMTIKHKACYNNLDKHKESYILLPHIELTSYSRNIFMGIIHKFHFQYQNIYMQQGKQNSHFDYYENYYNSFYKSTSCLNYKLMRTFKFWNPLILVPTLKLELVPSRTGYDFKKIGLDGFFTRYSSSLNMRFRVTDWMDWNTNYSLRAITKKNSLSVETLRNDYGIEKNSVSFNNNMYFGKQTMIQNSFSYNLQQYRSNNINDIKNSRWSPFTTEVTCILNDYVTVFSKQVQVLNPFKFSSLNLDLTIGQLDKTYLNFGAFCQRYNKLGVYKNREANTTLGFGLCLTPKWRIDYSTKATISFDSLSQSKIAGQELKISRDLHCYILGIVLKKTTKDEGVFFNLSTKTNAFLKGEKPTWWSQGEED
jgi:LPS-assembly protein